jgi:hypothetical protein
LTAGRFLDEGNELVPDGRSMFLIAWGRMMKRMVFRYERPSTLEASHCPFGTASIPPRTISPTYPEELMERPIIPAVKAGRFRPREGSPK